MRNPTKVALKHLAETMVENGSYINLRGTGDFINEAVKLHRKTGSFVTVDTIRRHQKELEQMCQDEMLRRHPLKKDIIIPKQFDDDVEDDCEDDADIALYDEMSFQVDDSMIISIAMAKIERMMRNQPVKMIVPKKNHNMFYFDHNGSLCWSHGQLSNAVVGTPGLGYYNKANRWVGEKGHAIWLTSDENPKFKNHNFTEDDLEVLKKLSTSTYD